MPLIGMIYRTNPINQLESLSALAYGELPSNKRVRLLQDYQLIDPAVIEPYPVPVLCAEHAFTASVAVGKAIVVGKGPDGLRRYIPIIGGSVRGALLTGTVIAGGGDSQIVRSDGSIVLEARYLIETHDNVMISVVNRGLRNASPEIMERLARGEHVLPAQYYFRTVAQFEAPFESQYDFFNLFLLVATAEREAEAVIVHFYRVL
jgi:hypothetical protein